MGTNKHTRDKKTEELNTLYAQIDQLTAEITTLTQEIADLSAGIAEIDKAMAEATEVGNLARNMMLNISTKLRLFNC